MQFTSYRALAAAAVLSLCTAWAQAVTEPGIATQLEAMGEQEQEVRLRWIANDNPEVRAEVERIDAANQAALSDIVARKGWPDIEMVGKPAAQAAWLITQHAPQALIKQYLPYMTAAAEKGTLPWSAVALSIDRDLMYDHKPQRYGSQFRTGADGNMVMYEVEDEAHLDERRAKVGLESMAQYKAEMEQMYHHPAN